MEYVYAAMLLHKAGQKISEASVKKVLEAAGVRPEEARVKALVASLEGVDIDKAVEKAAMPVAAPTAAVSVHSGKAEEKKEEKSAEKEQKEAEQAAAGLGALFG